MKKYFFYPLSPSRLSSIPLPCSPLNTCPPFSLIIIAWIYIYIYKHTHIYVYSHIFFSSPWALFRLSHLRGKYILSTCRWKSDSEAEIKLAASSPLVRHWTGGFATKLFFLSETSGLLDAIGQIHQRASNTSQSIAAKIVALVSQNCPSN